MSDDQSAEIAHVRRKRRISLEVERAVIRHGQGLGEAMFREILEELYPNGLTVAEAESVRDYLNDRANILETLAGP